MRLTLYVLRLVGLRILGAGAILLAVLQILDLLMQGVQCNCELGEALDIAPNLISHHLSALHKAGLVDVERDADDARWVYYSINRIALSELTAAFGTFFDPARIRPRRPDCGPHSTTVPLDNIAYQG